MAGLASGRLDRKITILRPELQDDGFARVEDPTPAEFITVRASKADVSDGERARGGELAAQITTRFRIRWSADAATITPRDKLQLGSVVYDIVAVKEMGRAEGIEISATARADLRA